MKNIFKKAILSSLLISGFCLTSCNNTTTSFDGSYDDTNLSGNLIVWWPGGSTAVESVINDAVDRYEELHPKVSIDIRFQSTADFYFAYNMALLGNEFPDVAYIDHVYVQRLAYDGSIANLNNFGLQNTKDLFIDSLWKPNLYQGDLYALPMSANSITRVYNKALLDKVLNKDTTEEDLPIDWESYIELGDKIKAYNKENNLTGNEELFLTTVPAGTGAESFGAMYYLGMSSREGGTIMNEDFTQMTLSSQENMNAATKIQQLGKGGYTPTVFSESKFETGKVAFIEMGSWKMLDYSRMNNDTDMNIKYAPIMPNEEGGDISSGLGLYSLVLTRKSQNQALAADFIKFVTTDYETQVGHNSSQYLMPTTKEALEDEFYDTADWEIYKEQLNHSVPRPGSAAWPTIEKELAQFVTGLVNGEREPNYLYSIQAALEEVLYDFE